MLLLLLLPAAAQLGQLQGAAKRRFSSRKHVLFLGFAWWQQGCTHWSGVWASQAGVYRCICMRHAPPVILHQLSHFQQYMCTRHCHVRGAFTHGVRCHCMCFTLRTAF